MKKYRCYILYTIIHWLIVHNAIGGTILSSIGVGTPFSFPHTRSLGMGGVTIALEDYRSISRTNPANISSIRTTFLSIQYFYESNKYRDRNDQAFSQYGNFDGFSFIVPLGSGINIAGGLLPLTRIDYNLSFDRSLNGEDYTKSIQGNGGLNSFSLSLSWAVRSNLSLGCSAKYIFGRLTEEWRIEYSSSGFQTSDDLLSTKNWGYGLTTGISYSPFSFLTIGAIYSPNVNLNNRTEITHYLRSKYETHSGSLNFPQSWGIGSALKIWENSIIGIDYEQQYWSKLSINQQPVHNIRNNYRIALGAEFPSNTNPLGSYLSRIAFRLGISYQPYYSLDLDGNTISERLVSIGFGLPFTMNNAQIDMALCYGTRGSINPNGLTEHLFRLGVSISGSEKWFSRTQ